MRVSIHYFNANIRSWVHWDNQLLVLIKHCRGGGCDEMEIKEHRSKTKGGWNADQKPTSVVHPCEVNGWLFFYRYVSFPELWMWATWEASQKQKSLQCCAVLDHDGCTVAVCKHSFSITQSVCALSLFEVSDANHKIWIVSGMLLSILDASTLFYISLKIKVCHGMMTVTMETSNGNISKNGSRDMWHETSSQYKRTLPAHLLWRTSAGTLPWITQAFRWAVWRVTTRSAAEGCLWKETGRNVIQM